MITAMERESRAQDRENRSPRFGDADAPGCREAFSGEGSGGGDDTRSVRLSKDAAKLFPLPGGEG